MPERVALASRLVVALLTLMIGALAAGAVVMGALAFVMLAFGGAWSGEPRWFGRHWRLVFNALASGVALLAVAVPALAVWLVRRARPQATRPSGLGAAWGVLVGLLPFLAGALLLRFLTRSFLAGERLDWADAVLGARPALESLLPLTAALGAGLGAFLGSAARVREHGAQWSICLVAAAGLGALLPSLWAGVDSAARPALAGDAPMEAAPEPLFVFPGERFERATPVVADGEENVYLGSADRLVCLGPDGRVRWSVRDGWQEGAAAGAPVLTREGLVVVAVGEGVFGFDRSGRRAWSYAPAESGGWVEVLLAAPEGGVYASYGPADGSGASVLRALGAAGEERWSHRSESRATLVSLVSGDRVLVSGAEHVLLDAQGRRVWSHAVVGSALPAPDGRVYFLGRTLQAVAADGSLLWERPHDLPAWSFCGNGGVAVGDDGTLFVSCGLHALAFRPDGSALWQRRLDGTASGPPVLGADGTVYVAAGSLWALGRDGAVVWRARTVLQFRDASFPVEPNPTASPPLLLADGTLIVGCARNRVYAVAPDGRVRWVYAVGSEDSLVLPVTGLRLTERTLLAHAGKLIVFARPDAPGAAPSGPGSPK